MAVSCQQVMPDGAFAQVNELRTRLGNRAPNAGAASKDPPARGPPSKGGPGASVKVGAAASNSNGGGKREAFKVSAEQHKPRAGGRKGPKQNRQGFGSTQ